jgi:hypothetical protein
MTSQSEVGTMLEMLWVVADDQDERSAVEQRERAQAAEVRELQRAIAEDHRRRDQMIEGRT